MERWHLLAYFAGGAFLVNALPHFLSGLLGRAFQTPFAKPRGEGLSSATVNVLCGFVNLVVAYGLFCRTGRFDARATLHAGTAGAGGLLMGLMLARHFGKFHGGNRPERS